MFLDGIIVAMTLIVCINGWQRGLLRSMRGFVAIVVATLAAPYLYPHLANWLNYKIDLNAAEVTVTAYLLCWVFLSALVTAVLVQASRQSWLNRPWILDRLGGFGYGLAKAAFLVVLALAVSMTPVKLSSVSNARFKPVFSAFISDPSKLIIPLALPWAKCLAGSETARKYILAP